MLTPQNHTARTKRPKVQQAHLAWPYAVPHYRQFSVVALISAKRAKIASLWIHPDARITFDNWLGT
jgi:hypothetical protein